MQGTVHWKTSNELSFGHLNIARPLLVSQLTLLKTEFLECGNIELKTHIFKVETYTIFCAFNSLKTHSLKQHLILHMVEGGILFEAYGLSHTHAETLTKANV